jgi:hypothetical protein
MLSSGAVACAPAYPPGVAATDMAHDRKENPRLAMAVVIITTVQAVTAHSRRSAVGRRLSGLLAHLLCSGAGLLPNVVG